MENKIVNVMIISDPRNKPQSVRKIIVYSGIKIEFIICHEEKENYSFTKYLFYIYVAFCIDLPTQ